MATASSDILPPRRDEVLAFILERIALTGICPTLEEIATRLGVQRSRAQQLVGQLVRRGILERTSGSQRNLRVRDTSHSQDVLQTVFLRLGWTVALPMGEMQGGCPKWQLPVLPPFEHLPGLD